MKNLLYSYRFFIVLCLISAVLTGLLFAGLDAKSKADTALSGIESKMSQLNSKNIQEKAKKLLNAQKTAGISTITSDEANRIFLQNIDSFLQKYNAKVVSGIQDENSTLKAKISFRYTPKTPAELAQLLEYMENSVSPVFLIESAAFFNTPTEKYINITAEIVQPYIRSKK